MFQDIFECSPLALILVDAKGVMKYVNREAEHLFGYAKSEMEGQPIEILVPEEFRNIHPGLRMQYFGNPSSRAMGTGRNLFGQRKDGNKFPIEVGLNPIKSLDQTFIVSSIIDISARIRAEEKFKTAFEAAPNGMIMVDSDGTIILANAQTEKMFAYTKAELLGQPIELLVPMEVKERHPKFFKAFIEAPSPRSMGAGRDLFGRRKDGTQFNVEIGLRPFQGADGLHVISSIVDITERIKDKERLMARNEELQQFAYRTSHDLKAPLISIHGLAEYIVSDVQEKNEGEVLANAGKIIALSIQLKNLLDDILALTKADYFNEPVEEIHFEDVIANARLKFEILTRENGVEIRQVFAHTKTLKSQPTRLTQVVDNLISNAIKYCDSKKDSRHVTIRTFSDTQNFYLQVEDNGLGIPQNKQAEVFGMFKRFHRENVQGSGLGLYLVKKHVLKLAGQISFESSPQGTTYSMSWPLLTSVAAIARVSASP